MTQHNDLDRMLSAWLDDPYTPPAPRYLGQVLERTRHTRQRPAWASLERWIPMADKVLPHTAAPSRRVAQLVLVALIVLALVATVAVVGSRLLTTKPTIPTGGAAVFTFASLVFPAGGSAEGDIYTAQGDGSHVRQLTSGPEQDMTPSFSPDGTRIAFRSWDAGTGTDSIVVMDAGGGHRMVLGTSRPNTPDCVRSGPAWSPDGTRLVYTTNETCSGYLDLLVVPADGGSPATRLLPAGMSGHLASWSPDGTQIAFLGSEQGGPVGAYVIDVGTSVPPAGIQARRVGSGSDGVLAEAFSGPRWSPDGRELAFDNGSAVFDDGQNDGFSIVKADGSGERLTVTNAHNPEWSADGQRLAFHRRVDRSEWFAERPCTVRIWVIGADGTGERRLDPLADGCGTGPNWSPDGTRVTSSLITATPTDPEVAFHVGVVTVDGSSPVAIFSDGGFGTWQPVVAPLPPAPSFPAP